MTVIIRQVLELPEHKEMAQCLERTEAGARFKSGFSYFLPMVLGQLKDVSQGHERTRGVDHSQDLTGLIG